jgi:hypothetical protein
VNFSCCCNTNIADGLSEGDILVWNGSAWVPNDQGIPGPGSVLVWDGTTWVPSGGTAGVVDAIDQALDISTTSNVYADMGAMSRTLTTFANGSIAFWFNATCFINNTGDLMYFRVMVDGVAVNHEAIGDSTPPGANNFSINGKTGALAAGAHTIKVQWKNASNVNTLFCRPATADEGAHLMCMTVNP